jgi:RNA polymerase sigma-70 factor (ECF subfamily)
VWRALSALTGEDRELLIMRAWDEMSVTEIALLLDCTPNAVSSRLHKARRRLTVELQRQEAASDGHVEASPRLDERSDRDR